MNKIGFEIEHQGMITKVAAESVHLIFSYLKMENREEISLDILGSNNFFEERLNWGSWKLERGDEFRIKVAEVDEITEPQEKEIKEAFEEQLKKELATYLSLKEELEKENLL
jgi:hypothetical protein